MAWIKYNASYKHGPGQTEWIDVGESSPAEIKDLFEEHDREHGDPEGFRTGEYEVVDLPPVEVLERKIKRINRLIASNQAYLIKLTEMLAQASN